MHMQLSAIKWKIKEILKVIVTKHFSDCINLSNLEEHTAEIIVSKTMSHHNALKYPVSNAQISESKTMSHHNALKYSVSNAQISENKIYPQELINAWTGWISDWQPTISELS